MIVGRAWCPEAQMLKWVNCLMIREQSMFIKLHCLMQNICHFVLFTSFLPMFIFSTVCADIWGVKCLMRVWGLKSHWLKIHDKEKRHDITKVATFLDNIDGNKKTWYVLPLVCFCIFIVVFIAPNIIFQGYCLRAHRPNKKLW